jgi:ribosomal protein L16 Arg81 hydroxylase
VDSPTLSQWVGDLDTFVAEFWRKRPGVFAPVDARMPITVEDVDSALDSGLLRTPYLAMTRVSHDGEQQVVGCTSARRVHQNMYEGYADGKKILNELHRGATLLLHRVDHWHAPTRELLANMAAELQRRVEAFFFVTPAGEQGLPLHRDDADVIVVQVAGSKQWHVHEGPEGLDWNPDRLAPGEQPAEVLRVVLRPGEVLYLPRGFAHRATAAQGVSAHLSLTIRELTTRDLVRTVQQALVSELALPMRPADEASLAAVATSLLDHFAVRLAGLTGEEVIDMARGAELARLPQAGEGSPLATFIEGTRSERYI